jgi:FkbM family methyltransferase
VTADPVWLRKNALVSFLTVAKRTIRIVTKRKLPMRTRWRLLVVELVLLRRKKTAIRVPLGDQIIELEAATLYVDYVTLYGMLIDEHFSLNFGGAVIIDIGAHKGYYGARALFYGATHVYSYEPERQNFAALNRAACRCPERWTIERCAVGPHGGTIELYVSSNSWSHSRYVPESGDILGTQPVTMRRLGDLLKRERASGDRIACKINAEGLAGEMILATSPSDWVGVNELWCDFEPSDPVPVIETIAHLADAGLHVSERTGRRVHFESY